MALVDNLDLAFDPQRISRSDVNSDPHIGVLIPYEAGILVPADMLTEVELAVVRDSSRDEHDYVKVGRIEATLYDTGAMYEKGDHPFDVFDAHSQDLHELYCALFDVNGGDIKPAISKAHDLTYVSRLLYIRSVSLLPEFRGQQLGLGAVHLLMHSAFTAATAAVVCATPLIDRDKPDLTKTELKKAQAALAKMYQSIGFKSIRGASNLMLANLDYTLPGLPESK